MGSITLEHVNKSFGAAQIILKPVLISELRDAIIRAYDH